MGDFQFTFNNQDSVGIHKKKYQSQQARDNLRQQEFKEKKLKKEIVDLEKAGKDEIFEIDTFESKHENKGKDNKEIEVEIENIWKVTAFCEAPNMDKLLPCSCHLSWTI